MEHHFYTKWYASDEEADHWISYLHRNFHHVEGEDSTFPGSEWSFSQEDALLHDHILDRLYEIPEVDASMIYVTVARGSVYLTGTVQSVEEKEKVTSTVEAIKGTWRVYNFLDIQSVNERRSFKI